MALKIPAPIIAPRPTTVASNVPSLRASRLGGSKCVHSIAISRARCTLQETQVLIERWQVQYNDPALMVWPDADATTAVVDQKRARIDFICAISRSWEATI